MLVTWHVYEVHISVDKLKNAKKMQFYFFAYQIYYLSKYVQPSDRNKMLIQGPLLPFFP